MVTEAKCEYRTSESHKCNRPAKWITMEGKAMYLCDAHVKAAKKFGIHIQRIKTR